MKGRFWKKLTAGAFALLMVSGGVPMQPIADMLGDLSITASARGAVESITIDLYPSYMTYGDATYNDFNTLDFSAFVGDLLGKNTVIWCNNNTDLNLTVYDTSDTSTAYRFSDLYSYTLDGVYEVTAFESHLSENDPSRRIYNISLTAAAATLTTPPQANFTEGLDFIEYDASSPMALVTEGTAVNGTVKYYFDASDPDYEPSEQYSDWSEDVPTVTERGVYRVWYKVEGTNGYFGIQKQYIDVSVHRQFNTISIDPDVPEGAVIAKKSNGEEVSGDQFFVGKPVEIRSTAKLDITGSEFADAYEQIDLENEEYVYTFTMPDEPLAASHTHSLRVYPGKNVTADKFGIYCTNEFVPLNALYTLSAESCAYSTAAAEATLTLGTNLYSDGLTVTNTPEITYYDHNGTALTAAPVDAGTYTAKAVVEYTFGGAAASRTIEKSFTISQKDIRSDDVAVTLTPDSQVYNGSAPSFAASVTINGEAVSDDNYEYTVSPNGSAAGAYTVTFTGKNSLKGTRSVIFNVNTVDTTENISVSADDKQYDAQPYSTNDITVTANDGAAQSFADNCEITYAFAEFDSTKNLDAQAYTPQAPVNAGTYAVRVTMALDNYVTVVKYAGFDILPRAIDNETITREIAERVYNSYEQTVGATLTDFGSELVEGVDYTITCDPQTNANAYYHTAEQLAEIPATESDHFTPGDPYTFTVTGIGNYAGSFTDSWYIKRRPVDEYGSIVSFKCTVGDVATIEWIVFLDDDHDDEAVFSTADPDYKNDFAVFVDGTEHDMESYKIRDTSERTITLRGIGNYEGILTVDGCTPAKLTTYGLDFEYIPKEYDGNMITWADFVKFAPHPDVVSEEEAFFTTCTSEEYYGGTTFNDSNNENNNGVPDSSPPLTRVSVMDINGTIIPLEVFFGNTNDTGYPGNAYVLGVIKNTDPSKGLVCDGISAGPNFVAYYSNYTMYDHKNFTKIVYITKAKAEHITDVAFAAQDKTYDGLPYDCTALTLISSANAENKVANEVVTNHGTIVYSFAAIPDGYMGELDELTYTTSVPPTNAGHYAVKAATSGANFEEVTFYDDFTIAKKAVTVTADDQTAVYLQDTLTPTAAAAGAVEGDLYPEDWNALFRYVIGTEQKSILDANTPVGTYDIIADDTMMNRTRYANYDITVNPATATVSPYDLSQNGGKAATSALLTKNVLLLSAAPQSIAENGNLTVTANNRTLTEGTDFILGGNTTETDVGSYTLTLSGTGNFTGEIVLPWRVVSQEVFTGRSASLGEKIELRFFVDDSAEILSEDGAYIEFTANGETTKTDLSAYGTQDGKRFYGFAMGPSHMTDEITAKICTADGTAVDVMTSTIASYAYDVKKTYPNDEKLNTLVDSMLRYGAAAQLYKSYNTNDLPINDLDSAFEGDDIVAAGIDDSHRDSPAGTSDGVTFLGQTASLDSDATMRLVFGVEGSVSDYTFTLTDPSTNDVTEVTPTQYRGDWSVDIEGMIPGDYDTKYVVTVTNSSDEMITVTRSLYGYIKSVLEGDYEARTKLLVKSMYYYNESADSYNV